MLCIEKRDERIMLRNCLVDPVSHEATDIYVQNGVIAAIGKKLSFAFDKEYDAKGKKIVPGLIDIHTHGCMGMESTDGEEAIVAMSSYYAERGTTTWYPTGTTLSISLLRESFSRIPETPNGANIGGYHSEGPYINYKYRGAQNPDYIKKAEIADLDDIEPVKMITLAPETEGAMDYIRQTRLLCILGHTDATYDTALEAFQNGAKCVTHLFNAMPSLHHREPSVLGAAYDGGAYVQLISDGTHIHPSCVRITYQLFGPERMILISDSVRPAFLPDGHYSSGGMSVTVENGTARIDVSGALAGSTSSLYQCVQKAIEFGIPPMDAYRMASETPAKMLKINKGRIEVGYEAEFLLLDDAYRMTDVYIFNK